MKSICLPPWSLISSWNDLTKKRGKISHFLDSPKTSRQLNVCSLFLFFKLFAFLQIFMVNYESKIWEEEGVLILLGEKNRDLFQTHLSEKQEFHLKIFHRCQEDTNRERSRTHNGPGKASAPWTATQPFLWFGTNQPCWPSFPTLHSADSLSWMLPLRSLGC